MAETTSRFALPLLQSGQAQKEVYHNEALAQIDLALHANVMDISVDAPPAGPAMGDCWIVGANPTGAWAGQAGAIAGWTSGGWRFVAPHEGMQVWCISELMWVQHLGNTWIRGRISGDALWLHGRQVVGERRPAIMSPAGGTIADTEARSVISTILEALRAHGLIDS
jgi:hypothetical protein